ncbi:glycosyltransferase family 2 protein, partial [Kingella kingae]
MKLDIIIPCYNAASTLNRAVESSLQQAELHQLWLVDDASTDNTWAHIQAWQARYPSRIQACRLPDNGGVARARNWGALQSQAEIIAFLDADDAYQAHALQAALY